MNCQITRQTKKRLVMRIFIYHEVIISLISVLLRRPCQKFLDLSP